MSYLVPWETRDASELVTTWSIFKTTVWAKYFPPHSPEIWPVSSHGWCKIFCVSDSRFGQDVRQIWFTAPAQMTKQSEFKWSISIRKLLPGLLQTFGGQVHREICIYQFPIMNRSRWENNGNRNFQILGNIFWELNQDLWKRVGGGVRNSVWWVGEGGGERASYVIGGVGCLT